MKIKPDINPKHNKSSKYFAEKLYQSFHSLAPDHPPMVFLCIGTDLVAGDSLGPLVGHRLRQMHPYLPIYGTLKKPVHAENLADTLEKIRLLHPNHLVIAIDAAFGSQDKLGKIFIEKGPIYPGLGVAKKLPPAGDISITGVVCTKGADCHQRLQSAPLSLIILQADTILEGICLFMQKLSLSDKYLRCPVRIFPAVSLQGQTRQTHH